ncbi:MAG: class I SAM-dependent methyltransferase [Candidatus Shapirobacteria bacterium]
MTLEYELEPVCCDYCGNKKYQPILEAVDHYNHISGRFNVVQCTKCHLVYTNPRPTEKNIHLFYPDSAGYYQPQAPTIHKKNIFTHIRRITMREYFNYYPHEQKKLFEKILVYPYYLIHQNHVVKNGIPQFVANGKLLDIGCSYGHFLYEMKQIGWNVTGIETNDKAVNWGKKNLNLNIIKGKIEDNLITEKFDVITMRMVLEHVLSPTATLKIVHNLLKPNGTLIITVPNFIGIENKIYKNHAYTLQVPTHITHFTPSTITQYLKKYGFKRSSIFFQNTDHDLLNPLNYMIRNPLLNIIKKVAYSKYIRSTIIKLIVNIFSLFHISSRMVIYTQI